MGAEQSHVTLPGGGRRRARRAAATVQAMTQATPKATTNNKQRRVEFEVTPDVGETGAEFLDAVARESATTRGIIAQHRAFMQDQKGSRWMGVDQVPKGPIIASSAVTHHNARDETKETDQLMCGRGLAQILLDAYSNHCGVELTPDILWGAFVTQLAFVVNANMRDLRSHLVSFQGKKELEVAVGDVREGVDALRDAIREQLADRGGRELVDLMAAEFSTTTDASRVLNTIALMASLQKMFTYTIDTRCGLPCVALLGTAEDWDGIPDRMRAVFHALPLPHNEAYQAWQGRIVQLAKECALARRGQPNVTFWQRMVDRHSARRSGVMATLSGWLPLTLCAFQSDGTPTKVAWTDAAEDGTVTHHVEVTSMPFGCVSVPVTLKDESDTRATAMVAGIMAAQVRKGSDGRVWLAPRAHWYMANHMWG